MFGFGFQSLGDQFWQFARAELDDARKLVEKITSLGGEPAVAVADARWTGDPGDAVDWIIKSEGETIEALREAIEPTGREGRSEALEPARAHDPAASRTRSTSCCARSGRPRPRYS